MPKRKCSSIKLSLGVKLKQYRDACGLTQQQVANVLNINRTTYTKYETGVSEPSHELLSKIVTLFGTDFNAILGDEDTFVKDVFDMKMPMYNLTKREQNLVSCYRTFTEEEKEKVDKLFSEIQKQKMINLQ